MTLNSVRQDILLVGVSVLGLCAVVLATPVVAGDAGPPEEALQLSEIVVTAQKRAENVQEVPIAITAVTDAELKASGVTNIKDIQYISSGVNVADPSGYIFPIVRGIGSFIQGPTTYNSVSTYVDGVYVSRLVAGSVDLGNIQSLDILKGPQATLYGRNSTGGAIDITTITTHPGDPSSGYVDLTYGNFNEKRADFYAQTSLGSLFAVNATGYWIHRDGFVTNLAPVHVNSTGGEYGCGLNLDSDCEYGGNVKFTFDPNDRTEFTLSFRGDKFNDTSAGGVQQLNPAGANAVLVGLVSAGPPYSTAFGPGPYKFATAYGTSYGWANGRSGSDSSITLNVNYRLDTITVTSITNYTLNRSYNSTDLLDANIPTLGFNGIAPAKNYSEELHALSSFSGPFNFLVGVNYIRDESDPTSATAGIFADITSTDQVNGQSDRAAAPYGELYYNFTDALKLTVGGRYTKEVVEGTSVIDATHVLPPGARAEVDDSNFSYRAVLDYQLPWGLAYVSRSTGFKSGGVNSSSLAAGPFGPEVIKSDEVGIKTDLFEKRLRIDAAAFLYDITGVQGTIVGGPTGGAQFFVNGSAARDSGLEMNFDTKVTQEITLQGGVTYLAERKYTDFNIPASAVVEIPALVVTGNKLVGAPEWSMLLGARYDRSLGNAGTLGAQVNGNYNTGYYLNIQNTLGTGGLNSASAVKVLNARVDYTLPAQWDFLKLSIWGTNLNDDHYYRAGISALGGATVLGSDGEPRQFGVTVTGKF